MTTPEKRVLAVLSAFDYGDPSRGYSFEWFSFLKELEALYGEVKLFDAFQIRARKGVTGAEESFKRALDEFVPDVIFAVVFRDEIRPEWLSHARDVKNIPVVLWSCDDHWRYDEVVPVYAPHVTLPVTTSREAVDRYDRDGFRVHLSQWGYPAAVFGKVAPPTTPLPQFAFVGQAYGERRRYLDAVSEGLPPPWGVARFGFGSPGGRLGGPEMIDLFRASAASLNFSGSWSPGFLGRLRRGYLRSRPLPRQLKARVFEVTGAGGLLITEFVPDLAEYFEIGREVLVFEDKDELLGLVADVVADPSWASSVRSAGWKRCLAEHSMSSRLSEVFNCLA